MKKKCKVIIIVLVVLIGLIGGSFLILSLKYPDIIPVAQSMLNNHKRAYVSDEDFELYFNDFQTVADMAISNERELKRRNTDCYMVNNTADNISLFDLETLTPVVISEKEAESLSNINLAYDNSGGILDRIILDDRFVTIEISNHRFAVVYSRDGSKPKTIVGLEGRGYSFYTRKVHDNWYFVTGT